MKTVQIIKQDKKNHKCSFAIKDTNISFVNAIRRCIIDYVPTMAIEDVEFRKNTSILYDEMIAHRLGLLVLTTDLKGYFPKSKCKCKDAGCPRCSLKLTLKAKGPGIVYASQIKSQDPKIKVVYPETPIVKLLKGQELDFEATAILGFGKMHAKWTPALAYYKHKPEIEITKKCKACGECAKICPKDIFEEKNGNITIKKENVDECHLCGACLDACPEGAIKINEKEKEFIFNIESWGHLECNEIIAEASSCYEELLEEMDSELKNL